MNGIKGVSIGALAFVSVLALADGDPEAGREKAKGVCAACHGMDGQAIVPEYPDIGGQNAPYIVSALKAYKNNQRAGGNAGIMTPQARNLTEQDILDLAAYYSLQGKD